MTRLRLIPADGGGFDGEGAPLGHGIAGIHDQVNDHLLELGGVNIDVADLRIRLDYQLDRLTGHLPYSGLQLGDRGIEVYLPWVAASACD